MAVLTDPERVALWLGLMAALSATRTGVTLTKAQLRAAVDAADQWCDDNAASYNTALPVAARTALTASQKALLLSFVAQRRAGV